VKNWDDNTVLPRHNLLREEVADVADRTRWTKDLEWREVETLAGCLESCLVPRGAVTSRGWRWSTPSVGKGAAQDLQPSQPARAEHRRLAGRLSL